MESSFRPKFCVVFQAFPFGSDKALHGRLHWGSCPSHTLNSVPRQWLKFLEAVAVKDSSPSGPAMLICTSPFLAVKFYLEASFLGVLVDALLRCFYHKLLHPELWLMYFCHFDSVIPSPSPSPHPFSPLVHCCSVTKSALTLCDPQTAAHQASLSFTVSQGLFKLMSIESVMPPNHLTSP